MKRLFLSLKYSVLCVVMLSSSHGLSQTDPDLLETKLRDLFHEALSGELAKDHVIQITRHHRIQGSRGYRNAAQYVLGQLRSYGFGEKEAFVESFVSDGKYSYQTWQSPSGWDVTSAELRMVEPAGELIVSYPEIAMSLITYSNSGEATAELVWVGRGTSDEDYLGKQVVGKFVLATGYGGDVHRLAVLKYGARAVICYLDDERAQEYPDMLQYTGMWPKTEELLRVTWGFNLTNRQGTKLRKLLDGGKKVVMQGRVKGTGLEPYFMDVVVARIRGVDTPEEEVVFSAHLDHPKESANDNASGSAAILDIARTMNDLIDRGKIPRPKKTIRFLWVPEFFGTMAYIDAHQELLGPGLNGKVLANINMDMVGEHPEILHSKLLITRTPLSLPSVLNDAVAAMAEMVDELDVRTPRGSLSQFNYRITPYSGGSDHMMFIDRKVPGVMFSHDDYTHHTSEDTPDKVDPVELERCEIIATSALWYLANLEPAQGTDLAHWATAQGMKRLGMAYRRSVRMIQEADRSVALPALTESQNVLDYAAKQEIDALSSILTFNNASNVRRTVDVMKTQLKTQFDNYTNLLRVAATEKGVSPGAAVSLPESPDRRIPIRLTRGPLALDLPEAKLSPQAAAWYKMPDFPLSGEVRFELVNFIDGKRTVSEIRSGLSAEFGTTSTKTVSRYLDDLVRVGVVRWK
jgi:hypothetical protein